VRQRTELTGTNRSCGLTTYIFRGAELWQARPPGESTLFPFDERGRFESRREKVEAVGNRAPIKATLVVVSFAASRRSTSTPTRSAHLTCQAGLIRPDRASHFVVFFPGGYTEEVTPVPIPNTEVKLFRADGTAGATLWESRTLPGF
jgi:hypothetical protein